MKEKKIKIELTKRELEQLEMATFGRHILWKNGKVELKEVEKDDDIAEQYNQLWLKLRDVKK